VGGGSEMIDWQILCNPGDFGQYFPGEIIANLKVPLLSFRPGNHTNVTISSVVI